MVALCWVQGSEILIDAIDAVAEALFHRELLDGFDIHSIVSDYVPLDQQHEWRKTLDAAFDVV